jgi:microcystin-dependent protein
MATYNNTDGAFYLHGFFGTPSIPIGAGLDYWLPTTPSSAFAFPIGQAISRTTYATLFAAMGTTFGAGDGSTTFNLPDKRSYVSIAADNMGGTGAGRTGLGFAGTGGVQTQTLNYTNMAPHSHGGTTGADSPDHAHTIGGGATLIVGSSSAPNGDPGTAYVPYPTIAISGTTSGATARHAHPISTDAGPGTSAPFSIMQPTIACNYILRII